MALGLNFGMSLTASMHSFEENELFSQILSGEYISILFIF